MSFDTLAVLVDLEGDPDPAIATAARIAEADLLRVDLVAILPAAELGRPAAETNARRREAALAELAAHEDSLTGQCHRDIDVERVVLFGAVEPTLDAWARRTAVELLVVGPRHAAIASLSTHSVLVAR